MTVLDLIKALSFMPPRAEVKAYEDPLADYDPIVRVELNDRHQPVAVWLITQYGDTNE
jgi:hypothetical protein